MATVGDDCYFFCTSTCSKGANCPFRHVEAAKTCRIICQHWQMGGCLRPSCKFRHSDFHIQINPTEISCYWETQPCGCTKSNCPFKHSKPRPEQQEGIPKAATNPTTQSENPPAENGTSSSAVKFVAPVVDPVVIEPDSEASNSSPVKSLDKRKTDDQKESAVEAVKDKGKDLHEEESTSTDNTEKKKSAESKKTQKGNLKKNAKKLPGKKKNVGTNKKGTIQKKQEKSSPKEVKRKKAPPPPPKKVGLKDRLGTARKKPEQISKEEDSGSESTDSDDSIENVKVLSMEEIFRQKALESMMKKRAAEGKPMLPPSVKAARRPAGSTSKPSSKIVLKSPVREAPKPKKENLKQKVEEEEESDAEEEDEDSEEEEEEEEDEEEEDDKEDTEDEETEDEEEDSSESSSESSESEEEIEAPRRVIIDIDDDEKLGRKKKAIKGNLQKKALMKSDVKVRKREVIREPAIEEEPPSKKSRHMAAFSQPLAIRKRLGKPVFESKDLIREERSEKFATKRKLIVEDERFLKEREDSDEDTNLGGIKIKTLEEIRAEKARRLNDNIKLSPQKELQGSGIQPLKRTIMLKDEEKESALSDPGVGGKVEKKIKKRPWKRHKTVSQPQEEEDHRTVSAAAPKLSGDGFEDELEQYKAAQKKEEEVPPDSPTESLRRRALLKKAQTLGLMREGEEVSKKSSKKSKHKHKHKKKSKMERQLYVPPALKGSGSKSLPSDDEIAAVSDEEKPLDLLDSSDDVIEKVAPQRAVAQKVGALWAAGLNASSKGLGARVVPKKEVVKETEPPKPIVAPAPVAKKIPGDESLLTIKTFSQIMAEKKQKRLLLQQQQTKNVIPSSESKPASIQSESNPRVPISPIVFNSGDASKRLTKSATSSSSSSSSSSSTKASLKTTNKLLSEDTPSPSKLSGSLKQDLNTVHNERSKKIFKKPILKEFSVDPDKDSSVVNKNSQSLETSSRGEMVVKSAAPSPSSVPSLLLETELVLSTEKPEKRPSLEDEFSFFEDDDLDDGALADDVEPIDDLLQDIDSLLA